MSKNDIYNVMADRLGAPGSKRFTNILKATFTPEEGEIILQLQGNPMTLKQLASVLNVDEESTDSNNWNRWNGRACHRYQGGFAGAKGCRVQCCRVGHAGYP